MIRQPYAPKFFASGHLFHIHLEIPSRMCYNMIVGLFCLTIRYS